MEMQQAGDVEVNNVNKVIVDKSEFCRTKMDKTCTSYIHLITNTVHISSMTLYMF